MNLQVKFEETSVVHHVTFDVRGELFRIAR